MSSEIHRLRWSLATIILAPRGGQAAWPSSAHRRELFAWAAGTGFEGIEISPRWYNIFALDNDALIALRDEVARAGLSISGINVERAMVVKSKKALQNRERIQRAIDIAAIIGARLVDVALAQDWEDAGTRMPVTSADFSAEDFTVAAVELSALARRAADLGIALSIELHDDGLLDTAVLCRQFIESVGEPNTGANPDIGNICRNARMPGDWADALVELAPIANCWHAKNYREGAPAPLADGDIDYCRALKIMLGAGYSGWVSIESRIGDFRKTQSSALRYLQMLENDIHGLQRSLLESVGDT